MVYKCAVLGVGGRGNDHVNWLLKSKRAEIVAVCDIDEKRAKTIAEKANAKWYTDYRELLEKEKLDAVFIASPHYLHAPMTIAAAEKEVNVFCEKPMAINLPQCDAMITACRKNDVKLAIGFQKRYVHEFKYLYDAIRGAKGDQGDLGRLTDITMNARHYRGEMYYLSSSQVDPKTGVAPGQWRGRWDTEGAGILINQAIHNIDIFRWICGPFKSLCAFGSTISKEHQFIEVEDTVAVSFELENGAVGTFVSTSANKKADENNMIIHGTDGYIKAGGSYAGEMIMADTRYKDEEDYDIPFTMDQNWNQVDNFFQALDDDKDPLVTGEEGRKSIELVRAILKSIKIDGPVRFPLKDSTDYPYVHNVNKDRPPDWL
jgi:UDP-N-acetyl-2-amino-2-deoxyglucuronate dehydrogenase